MIPWLDRSTPFPDVSQALTEADGAPGLLAAGADLSPWRLLQAYQRGIFPWFSEGQPILWWSTDPRMVLYTERFKISPSLRKTLRRIQKSREAGGPYQVRFDRRSNGWCAPAQRPAGTARAPGFPRTSSRATPACMPCGHAHSAELWRDGELVGGAYGVCDRPHVLWRVDVRPRDRCIQGRAGLSCAFPRNHGVTMVDCQQETGHLASLGATPISRAEFHGAPFVRCASCRRSPIGGQSIRCKRRPEFFASG